MDLHNRLLELRAKEKQISSLFLEVLQKMEDKRGYLKLGYSSLFDYLVRGFGYSESSAYQRQSCLRLSQELPEIKEKVEQGALSYSTLSMAYRSVRTKSTEEKRKLLSLIENKSTREVKKLLLEPAPPLKIKQQIYQDKVILRLELDSSIYAKLQRLKALKSHKHSLETLFESLVDSELRKYEKKSNHTNTNTNTNAGTGVGTETKTGNETGTGTRSRAGTGTKTKTKIETKPKIGSKTITINKTIIKTSSSSGTTTKKELIANVSEPEVAGVGSLNEVRESSKHVQAVSKVLEGSITLAAKKTNPRYISKRLRNDVLFSANYRCQYPGCEADHFLQIDHKIPVRCGGMATRDNLQVLCSAHNRMKG